MAVYPQMTESGGGALVDIDLTGTSAVLAGATSATFPKEIWNDKGAAHGDTTPMTAFLKITQDEGSSEVESGTWALDRYAIRAQVTSPYVSQSAKLGNAHYLQLPTLNQNQKADVEFIADIPADAPSDTVTLHVEVIWGEPFPVEPDLPLVLEITDSFGTLAADVPVENIARAVLPVDAELAEIVLELSGLAPEWTSGNLTFDVRAIAPGDPISDPGASIIGTGTAPTIAWNASTLRAVFTDFETRSFVAGTRFVADVTGVPAPDPDSDVTAWLQLNFRRY